MQNSLQLSSIPFNSFHDGEIKVRKHQFQKGRTNSATREIITFAICTFFPHTPFIVLRGSREPFFLLEGSPGMTLLLCEFDEVSNLICRSMFFLTRYRECQSGLSSHPNPVGVLTFQDLIFEHVEIFIFQWHSIFLQLIVSVGLQILGL